jgi:hypothetical protein
MPLIYSKLDRTVALRHSLLAPSGRAPDVLTPLLNLLRNVPVCALLAMVPVARGAETVERPSPSNPRYTGSPFVRTWLADDYVASPENFCVLQHPRTGLIYVGNAGGVLEFDGVRWRLIPAPGGGPVRSLCVDGRGRIWGCSGSMIFRVEPDADGELRAHPMLDRLPADFRPQELVYQGVATSRGVYFRDLKNLMFFGDDDGPAQAWRVAEGTVVILRLWQIDDEPYVTLGSPANTVVRRRGERFEPVPSMTSSVLAAHAEPDGTWRLATVHSIQWWSGTELTKVRSPLGNDVAQQSAFLADGRIVIATLNRGLLVCDGEGDLLQTVDRAKGLPANQVTGVTVDREGGVWATLPYGIARVQLDSPYARHGSAQGLEGTVRSLARHGDGLFAGGTEGVVRRGPDGRFRRVPDMTGSYRAVVAHDNWLFALSNHLDGLPLAGDNTARELENRNYYGLVPLAGAPGWFAHGSNSGLRWAHFAGDRWISEGPLKALRGAAPVLLEAPPGIVWTGVRKNGVARVDFRDGLRAGAPLRSFHATEGMPGAPSAMFMLGGKVVALVAGRLVCFDEAAGLFEPETRITGLDGFPIELAHLSSDGTLWLLGGPAGGREIRRVAPEGRPGAADLPAAGRWRAEALPGEPLRHLLPITLFHEATAKTLWIGGHGALVSRDLTWLPKLPPAPPVAIVRRIESADGKLIAAGDAPSLATRNLTLQSHQDALRISFAAPAFATDHTGVVHTQYRTRLDGLDHEWGPWSSQAERDLTNLPWREFAFRVQARDDAGRTGPEATFAFSIRPAWWATRWAWAGYGLSGLLGLAGFVRLRTRALHHRAERLKEIINDRTRDLAHSNTQLAASNAELARLNKLELDEKIAAQLSEEKARLEVLRYQLNPHFLYNSLNSIYGLLFENARDAGEMVLRLSDFCRAALTGASDELPTLETEIAALRIYLDVEQVRWNEKLVIEFLVAPEVAQIRMPPFLLLPLVENAIKYGSRTTPGVLRLSIRAFTAARDTGAEKSPASRAMVIEIANTGEWLPPDPARPGSTGIGLENLRQRLRRYYPDTHDFTTDAKDGWVVVRLSLNDLVLPGVRRKNHP